MKVYLDNSATTAPRDEIVERVSQDMKSFYGNPSSLHRMGLEAEKKINEARRVISKIICAKPKEIFFTSGGTEANNIAIQGVVERFINRKPHIITTPIEHSSVLSIFRHYQESGKVEVDYLSLNEDGTVNLENLEGLIKSNTVLVSVMMVNNETGVIQPIKDIKRIIKRKNREIVFHSDGVQAFGKMDIDVKNLGIDILTFSAHKIHSLKGVGGIYIKDSLTVKPIFFGGGQESGVRVGTENTFGIFGFGYAAEIMESNKSQERKSIEEMKKLTIDLLVEKIDNIKINSPVSKNFLSNILNISVPGTKAEIILHTLEEKEIYISTGSACSSNSRGKSHVLKALNLSEEDIEGSLRISFSYEIDEKQVEYFVAMLKEAVEELRIILKY